MVKYNQIIVKIILLFFVSAKTMHIGSFAQNTFNRCPPVLKKHFWTYKRHIGNIENEGLFYGQIQSNNSEN